MSLIIRIKFIIIIFFFFRGHFVFIFVKNSSFIKIGNLYSYIKKMKKKKVFSYRINYSNSFIYFFILGWTVNIIFEKAIKENQKTID